MDILKISAIGIITAVCVLVLKDVKSETSIIVGVVGGLLILLIVLDYFVGIFDKLTTFVAKAGIDGSIFKTLMKIIGVGYITDFSAGIIEDVGAKSLSDKVVLGGKIIILGLSLPIVFGLFDLIAGMLT